MESPKDGVIDLSWWDWFTNIMTVEGVAVCALIVNALAFSYSVWWIRRQAQATDLNNYFRFKEGFTDAWRRFRDAPEEDNEKEFEFVELLNLLETASRFYNNRTIHGATRKMVQDYLCEVIPAVFKDEDAKDRFRQNYSGPDTYAEIRQFARSHKVEGVPESR